MSYYILTDYCQNKKYYLNDILHREDGPAVERVNGTKEWYKNGELHLEDGPAIEFFYGKKEWYRHGFLHRKDGPAIEWLNGHKSWVLNDKHYGDDNDLTNESWIKFVKTLVFY